MTSRYCIMLNLMVLTRRKKRWTISLCGLLTIKCILMRINVRSWTSIALNPKIISTKLKFINRKFHLVKLWNYSGFSFRRICNWKSIIHLSLRSAASVCHVICEAPTSLRMLERSVEKCILCICLFAYILCLALYDRHAENVHWSISKILPTNFQVCWNIASTVGWKA